MLFATASLARRIETAEASLIADAARGTAARRGERAVYLATFNGGVAVHAGDTSPFNKVTGLGFDGLPSADILDEVERTTHARGATVRVEIATLADPAVVQAFGDRGYRLAGFENVMGRDLTRLEDITSRPHPAALVIQKVATDDGPAWTDTVTTAFLTPDVFDGPASDESFPRDVLEDAYADMASCPGFQRYIARLDGVVAAGGSLRIADGVAQLCGAATLPAFRRRGIQSALLRQRLIDAAACGCDLAVVTTQPGSKSQQNVQRSGFELLYARAVLVRSPGEPAP